MLTNADKGGRGVSQMLTNAVADKGGGYVSVQPIYPTLEIQGPMLTVTVTVTEESESEDDTSGEEVDTNNSILESEDESDHQYQTHLQCAG